MMTEAGHRYMSRRLLVPLPFDWWLKKQYGLSVSMFDDLIQETQARIKTEYEDYKCVKEYV
jgi:hypothetical protein